MQCVCVGSWISVIGLCVSARLEKMKVDAVKVSSLGAVAALWNNYTALATAK